MADEPPNLGFAEAGAVYDSASQNARVWTEQWVGASMFCANCGAARIAQYPNNRKVADFYCETCGEDYELKAQKGRFGRTVVDGAFASMCARLESADNPNLVLMNYDLGRLAVTDLFLVPKHFFVREVIQERKPLAPTARRAGWVGCNILLGEIPESGKIWFVRAGEAAPRARVLE
jgi:type II restriction enzyme